MELSSENEQCKTWEEQMYWGHFHTMHFYLVLPKDFHDHLVLPLKFSEQMSSKMPNKVSLVGPSGATWDVELSTTTGTLALVGDGWKDFAKAYNLGENSIMFFEYERNSRFKVLILNQNNLCEKESSYFVKKDLAKPSKRGVGETASSEMMEDNDDIGGSQEFVLSKKSKKGLSEQGRKSRPEDPRESRGGLSSASKSRAQSAKKPNDKNSAGKRIQLNEMEQNPINTVEKQQSEKVILSAGNNGAKRLSEEYLSHRRLVTAEEIETALKRANEALTEGSFVVIMRPTCVYKAFSLKFPSEWVRKNLRRGHEEVILRVGEKKWETKFYYPTRALWSGWKDFAIENNLEDSDVCLFKPASQFMMLLLSLMSKCSELSKRLPLSSVPYDSHHLHAVN